MTKEQIADKLKEYCEHELKMVNRFGHDPHEAVTRCYGAMMFIINMDNFDDELEKWWDDEMLPKFRELERKKKEKVKI